MEPFCVTVMQKARDAHPRGDELNYNLSIRIPSTVDAAIRLLPSNAKWVSPNLIWIISNGPYVVTASEPRHQSPTTEAFYLSH